MEGNLDLGSSEEFYPSEDGRDLGEEPDQYEVGDPIRSSMLK